MEPTRTTKRNILGEDALYEQRDLSEVFLS